MEEMNIDQVVDVPDTPDRLAARHINGAQSGKESNSSVAGPSRTDFRDKECLNQPGARSSENGHLNPQRIAGKMTGFEPHSKSVALSPSENSCPSKNAPLFGRGTMAYNSKPETGLSIGMQHTDKRKPESTKIPSRSRVHIEEEALFDMAFLCRASKTLQSEKTRDVQVSSNGGSNLHFAPTTSNNAFKGKEKIGVNAGNSFGLTINDGKGIDLTGGSQPKIEKQISSPHVSVISPKVIENIILLNLYYHFTFLLFSSSDPYIYCCGANSKAANETSDASRDALLGGWRGTRNRAKNICQIEGADGCFIDEQHGNRVLRRNSGNGNVTKIASDSGDQGEGQTASRPVSGLNKKSQSHHNIHSKRQKKHRLTSRNHSECSTMVPDDSEILFLGSSEASSSSRSSRTLNRQHQGLGSMNDDSDSRARQVEADEILARELQEQLYHETPIFGGSEIDENIAWVLQQEEDAFRNASSQNHPRLRLRSSATMHANRQPQPQSFQNPSNRRRAQAQVPAARTSLRNRLLNRHPSALSRARNHSHTALSRASSFQFPLGMDLDMRLDILEALEDAVGEFSDMNMTASRILQVQRDFNENDYEMLLALDENNHQHGASVNRINSLPESVVQTENFEETCAICLETPTIGELYVIFLACINFIKM
ncbi:hypothetical protein GH714_022353 [Hevea brasiliensis]|uniref:Uncharacterized protein n=1 Tax=Hevea brasiliensis TaxID=3981 RepID=A0A6A6MNK8_HEVBR|nr:hypothetical protein GH714_022353 [Hevea brasiliensis]